MNTFTNGTLSHNSTYSISNTTTSIAAMMTSWIKTFHNNITGMFDGVDSVIDNATNKNAELYKEIWDKILVARYKGIISEIIPRDNTYLTIDNLICNLISTQEWISKFIFIQNHMVATNDQYILFTIKFHENKETHIMKDEYFIDCNMSAILTNINSDLLSNESKSYKNFEETIKIMQTYHDDLMLVETKIIPIITQYLINDIKDFFNVTITLQKGKEIQNGNTKNTL